jgi:hypothetical protein
MRERERQRRKERLDLMGGEREREDRVNWKGRRHCKGKGRKF